MIRQFLVLAALGGCGGGSADPDAGPPDDARHFADAAHLACDPTFDAGCANDPLTPVCDPVRAVCVECLGDGDCSDGSFGPTCLESAGYCQCQASGDCEGNDNGPRCHLGVHACACLDDGDCPGGRSCEQQPYLGGGVKTCQPPP